MPTSWPRVMNASATMSSSGHVFFAFSLVSISLRAGCSSSGPGGTKRDEARHDAAVGKRRRRAAPRCGAFDLAPGHAQSPIVVGARRVDLEVVQHPTEHVDAARLDVDAVELECAPALPQRRAAVFGASLA